MENTTQKINSEKFTREEAALLLELLGKIQLSPLAPDAAQSVELIRSIARKIEAQVVSV